MRKLTVALALIAASFALVASVAEAASTSEREGRKFSRKFIKKEDGQLATAVTGCNATAIGSVALESAAMASLRAGSSACSATSKPVEPSAA